MRVALALVAVVGFALLAPTLAPYDPHLSVAEPLSGPSRTHPLGSNDIGQDLLSAWLWGARGSLLVAIGVGVLSVLLAWSAGILAGLSPRAEAPIMALTDLVLALPTLLLAILVLTLVEPSPIHLALTLGLLSWPAAARVVRAQVQVLRRAAYVEAARGLGATSSHIARLHLMPATLSLLPVSLVLSIRLAAFAEATLAFLGLGDPSASSWGALLGQAFASPLLFTTAAWTWVVVPPAAGIAALVLGAAWLGTHLEAEERAQARRSTRPIAASYRDVNSGERALSRVWLMRPPRCT